MSQHKTFLNFNYLPKITPFINSLWEPDKEVGTKDFKKLICEIIETHESKHT